MNIRNCVKAILAREGITMQQLVRLLAEQYGWSSHISSLSAKLSRESIQYREVQQIADVLDYELVWVKRQKKREADSRIFWK